MYISKLLQEENTDYDELYSDKLNKFYIRIVRNFKQPNGLPNGYFKVYSYGSLSRISFHDAQYIKSDNGNYELSKEELQMFIAALNSKCYITKKSVWKTALELTNFAHAENDCQPEGFKWEIIDEKLKMPDYNLLYKDNRNSVYEYISTNQTDGIIYSKYRGIAESYEDALHRLEPRNTYNYIIEHKLNQCRDFKIKISNDINIHNILSTCSSKIIYKLDRYKAISEILYQSPDGSIFDNRNFEFMRLINYNIGDYIKIKYNNYETIIGAITNMEKFPTAAYKLFRWNPCMAIDGKIYPFTDIYDIKLL